MHNLCACPASTATSSSTGIHVTIDFLGEKCRILGGKAELFGEKLA